MNKIFSMRWPKLGKAIEAEIIEKQDQALQERFWNALPFSSIQSHAVCAGIQMYCPFRLVCLPSNPFYEPMNEQLVGRISLELDFQYLAINYGPMEEPVPALPIAQVKEKDIEDHGIGDNDGQRPHLLCSRIESGKLSHNHTKQNQKSRAGTECRGQKTGRQDGGQPIMPSGQAGI